LAETATKNGRAIMLQPLYDGKQWRQWVPGPKDTLVELKVTDFIEGLYFAQNPASEDMDASLSFLEIAAKRLFFPEVSQFVYGISADINNLGAVMWKLDHFFDKSPHDLIGTVRIILTEFEYTLVVCRSLLDLLQSIISLLWSRVRIEGFATRQIPMRFRKIVLCDNRIRSIDEIKEQFKLPEPFARFYAQQAGFFQRLRKARDDIIHRTNVTPLIFRLDQGFAVKADGSIFADLVPWDSNEFAPNQLGSLRFLVAYLVRGTFKICEEFADTVSTALELPDDIAPSYHVFLRGPFVQPLRRLEVVCEYPWKRFIPLP
jgi:hypothetical protein